MYKLIGRLPYISFALRDKLTYAQIPDHANDGKILLAASLTVSIATIATIFSPLRGWLGFIPPPPLLLDSIAVIVFLCVLSAEVTKRLSSRG